MAPTSGSSSSCRRLTMVYLGARLSLLSLSLSSLLLGGMVITPAVSSPTADPPADHESILHALRFQGLTASADALDNVIWNHGFLVPASATLFVPLNDAMAPVATSLYDNITELIQLLSYHIVTENLPVGEITQLPVDTKLQTMVENKSLVVTENSKTLMTINHKEVLPQDLCTISTVACYAVTDVLLLESGAGKKSFGASLAAASGEAPTQPPTGVPLPSLGAPVLPPVDSPVEAPLPSLGAPVVSPVSSPVEAPLPSLGAPVVSPVGSPVEAPVPARAPTMFLPPESPVSVPVPAIAPAVTVSPPSGSPSTVFPFPGSPRGAPLSPGEAPEGAPLDSAAMATTASTATLVAAVMWTILVL